MPDTPEPPAPTPSATTCATCGKVASHLTHHFRQLDAYHEFRPAPPTPEPPAPTPSATTAKCARCHGRGYILDYAGGESEPECRACNGTGRATYYCMACPQTFSTAERANAHHDETGHNQTHRPPGSANRPVPPASAPAATAKPDMTWQCANCRAVLPVPPVIAERGGPMRCTACDGKGTKHYDRRPASAPTGEEAEQDVVAELREWIVEHFERRSVTLSSRQMNMIMRAHQRLTAQATALAALRALLHRVLDWYGDASDERWDAIEPDIRAALAPRQTTGDAER